MSLLFCRLCPWPLSSTIRSIWTKLHLSLHTRPIFVASHRSFNINVFIASQEECFSGISLVTVLIFLFVFAVVSKPSDCIFPYDFKDAVRKKVGDDGDQLHRD